jgi:integrase
LHVFHEHRERVSDHTSSRLPSRSSKSGDAQPEGSLTLTEFVEQRYLPSRAKKLRPSTMLGYRDMFRKYVKPRAGNIRLRDFHTKDGRHLFDRISEEVPNLSHTTLMHVKALMSGIFTYARQEDAVREANPMQGVKAEGRRYKPTRETYSLNEISVMLPKIPEPARTVVMVAAFSGLRASEIRGLRWEDYTGTELRVVRSVWRTHIGRTKTEESGENLSFQSCAALSTSIGCAILAMGLSLLANVKVSLSISKILPSVL